MIEDKAQMDGYNPMICSSDEDPEKEINLIKMLIDSQQVDGLIISSTLTEASQLDFIKKRGFPCVLIDRVFPGSELPSVTVDNEMAAYEATEMMLQAGSKNIALLTISPGHISTIADRRKGFLKACDKNKLSAGARTIIEIPFSDIKNSVYENLDHLLKKGKTGAIFAANNNIALACMEYFIDKKIKVPAQLKFVSFDDIDVFRFSNPTITAVEQPVEEIGSWSFKVLKDLLENSANSVNKARISLPTRLIRRNSC